MKKGDEGSNLRLREPVQQAEGEEQEGGQQGLEGGDHQGSVRGEWRQRRDGPDLQQEVEREGRGEEEQSPPEYKRSSSSISSGSHMIVDNTMTVILSRFSPWVRAATPLTSGQSSASSLLAASREMEKEFAGCHLVRTSQQIRSDHFFPFRTAWQADD